jgi:hypothetical protein
MLPQESFSNATQFKRDFQKRMSYDSQLLCIALYTYQDGLAVVLKNNEMQFEAFQIRKLMVSKTSSIPLQFLWTHHDKIRHST